MRGWRSYIKFLGFFRRTKLYGTNNCRYFRILFRVCNFSNSNNLSLDEESTIRSLSLFLLLVIYFWLFGH